MNLKLLLASAMTLISGAAMAQSAPRLTPQAVIVNPVQTALQVNVRVDKASYVEGEKQRISVSVNQDAYVYLFDIQPDGVVSVLLPNGFSGGTPFLRANENRVFPPNGAGYELTIAAPFGQEKILAVASKRELNLSQIVPQVRTNQIVTASVQGQDGLARALAVTVTPLPPQDWVTDVANFETRSRNAPSTNGVLAVNVNPDSANVYVDGVLVGKGDTRINIPAGQRNVRVTAAGYQEFNQTVSIQGGQTVTVNANLQQISTNGVLAVNVNPNNANVYVDGVLVGKGDTRINIPAGQRNVRVTANGYQEFNQTVNIQAGQTVSVTANLVAIQQNGVLQVFAPNGAAIYVDGVLVGRGNLSLNIPAGTRNVRVTLDGYQEFQQTVTIQNGQTVTVTANLTPIAREGSLLIRSNIPGARVFINGNEIGVIGQDGTLSVQGLPSGSHELTLVAPNYRTFTANFNISGGQTTQITAQMSRLQ